MATDSREKAFVYLLIFVVLLLMTSAKKDRAHSIEATTTVAVETSIK